MAFWGLHAFQLEFFGTNYFMTLNYINQVFFVINCLSMMVIAREHQLTITFEIDGPNTIEKVRYKDKNKAHLKKE